MDPRVRCHRMKANPTGYLWSKYECFLMSGCQDMDLSKTKWRDGNANANADAKVSTIALPVLCTGELKTYRITFAPCKNSVWAYAGSDQSLLCTNWCRLIAIHSSC